ncbi:hypothetical protein MUP01_13045 [Candidatus Bathyarchaeota archaeon]|nr:hypothetical protein [Candidatus Bathyarchaeota archaeon]
MPRPGRILLTGIGGNTAQGVARSLLKFPEEFRIIGTDSDKYNVRFGLNYTKKVYLTPHANNEEYIPTLSKIVGKESVDLVIPSPDPEVYEISKHKNEIDAQVFLPNHKTLDISQDKWSTYQTLRNSVMQPKPFLISNHEDLANTFTQISGLVWLRDRKGAGGANSFLAHNLEQARFWIEYCRGYGKIIASEFLQGRNLGWIGLYKNGELITSGGYHRLRYYLEKISPSGVTGTINVGVTIHDSKLNWVAEHSVQALDREPNGVYTVDLKGDGRPVTTEVNAGRFHMSFYVYTEAGLNLPYYYAKLALGEEFELPPKRNALKSGIATIRSMDNEQMVFSIQDLGRNILLS